MIFHFSQFYISIFKPFLMGWITKIIYSGHRVRFGSHFRTDSIPRIIVNRGCSLFIGDHVEFRRNIEIRAHGNSSIKLESNTRIDRGVRILANNHSSIKVMEGARIGLYSVLNGGDSIQVGRKTLISGFVYLQTSMHNYEKGSEIQNQGFTHQEIILDDDVWIGAHAVILPGTRLGKGTVVGSNAVVNASFPENSVVAGVPAKLIKTRK